MATSSYDSSYRVGATTFAIAPGLTLAAYFGVRSHLICSHIQWISGGTLVVLGTNYGQTMAAATLATAGYHIVNNASAMEIRGPACFYVGSLGTTSVVSIQQCHSQGASFL